MDVPSNGGVSTAVTHRGDTLSDRPPGHGAHGGTGGCAVDAGEAPSATVSANVAVDAGGTDGTKRGPNYRTAADTGVADDVAAADAASAADSSATDVFADNDTAK